MRRRLLFVISILVISAWMLLSELVGDDLGRLGNGFDNLMVFFEESLWPPDWSVLEARSYPKCEEGVELFCSVAWIGMVETIKIAFIATAFGFVGALLLSAFAAKNLMPLWLNIPARIILAAMRSLPSIIWAIFFVIVIGFGPLSGVLAMTFYTVGYLGKLQYEAMEGMDNSPLEAGRAMGLRSDEIFIGIVIPETSNHLLSQLLFMFEYNVRHGTVIGIVGAGGIGYYINMYLKFLQYDKVIALLLIIFLVVVLIDLLSMVARTFVTEDGDVKRPSWFTILHSPTKAASHHHSDESE